MSDIKSTLFNITKSVTKTSGDLLKTTKLSMNLSTTENDLKALYLEIGKKVHEIYLYGGTLGKFFDEKFLEIEALERKISELKEQISVIKGTKNCPKCGKPLDRTAEFCQKCGIRVELGGVQIDHTPAPATPVVAIPEPEVPPPPAQKKCKVCGSENETSTKFCLSCGRLLD